VLESLPVARGSLRGGVRSQASLMQEVNMVMSRKRKRGSRETEGAEAGVEAGGEAEEVQGGQVS
jgi:hypothetical protein